MKIKNKTIFFLLMILINSFALAENYNISYSNEIYAQKYNDLIEKAITIAKINSKEKFPSNLEISINIGKEFKTISLSNAKNNNCNININYNKETPYLLSTFNNDLTFIIWHELSHCILDKKIFYNDFNWIINVPNENEINKIINKKMSESILSLSCLECDNKIFNIAPPILVYHEMFSDVLALIWWIKENKDLKEILGILEIRIDQYNNNSKKSLYASHFAIKELIDYIDQINDNNTLLIAEKIAQKGFLNYLINGEKNE